MQTIFFTDIRRLAPCAGYYSTLLRPERLKKMESYRTASDRLRCLAGGLLMEHIAGDREILYTEYGKPFLSGGPYFSLSHSENFACLAVSTSGPVGLDIEKQRTEDFNALGKTAFHPAELAFFLQDPKTCVFFDIWTLKESCVKMLGTGFSLEPSTFCILPGNMILPFDRPLFFQKFDCIDGYSMALCAEKPIHTLISGLFFTPSGFRGR